MSQKVPVQAFKLGEKALTHIFGELTVESLDPQMLDHMASLIQQRKDHGPKA